MKMNTHNPRINLAREVSTALNKRLTFNDQFNSFVTTVDIDSHEEVMIPNFLKNKNGNKILPRTWTVVDARGASTGSLGRSDESEWTLEQIFLTNYSVNDGTFTIRFFESE